LVDKACFVAMATEEPIIIKLFQRHHDVAFFEGELFAILSLVAAQCLDIPEIKIKLVKVAQLVPLGGAWGVT
jgi:hypothetical protein